MAITTAAALIHSLFISEAPFRTLLFLGPPRQCKSPTSPNPAKRTATGCLPPPFFRRTSRSGLQGRAYFEAWVGVVVAPFFLNIGDTSRLPRSRNATPLSIHSGRGLPSR